MKLLLVRARYHSVWEPINLMYIASYVERHVPNTEIKIMDSYFENDEDILVAACESDVVGFSGTTPQLGHMLHLAKRVKEENPRVKTVLGGFGPSLQPTECLREPYVDHVVMGEGEEAVRQIIVGEAKGNMVSVPPIPDIDEIPFPARHLISLERYISIAEREEGRRATSVLSERGCAFGCLFCAEGYAGTIWRRASMVNDQILLERPVRMRLRQPRHVADEMEMVRNKYNITFFKLCDAETNPTRQHFIGICQELYQRRWDTPWGANMRADKIDERVCESAAKADCAEFWIGVESGSEVIQRHINKGITIPSIRKAFALARRYGIFRRAYVLLGTPPESYATIKETEELLDEIDPDMVGFSILAPYPGTPYFDSLVKEHLDIDWENVDEYSNRYWHSDHLTNEELRAEQARLLEKYKEKLAPIVRKKKQMGLISAPTLDSTTGH